MANQACPSGKLISKFSSHPERSSLKAKILLVAAPEAICPKKYMAVPLMLIIPPAPIAVGKSGPRDLKQAVIFHKQNQFYHEKA